MTRVKTQQRMDALNRANEVRMARAEVKRDVREGQRSIDSLLLNPPPMLGSAPVADLLLQLPHYGPQRVGRLLKACSLDPSKTMSSLTLRQRKVLLQTIKDWAAARPTRREARAVAAAVPPPIGDVSRPLPPSKRRKGTYCTVCDERLVLPVDDGLCGWCREEAEMGRAA